MHATRISAAFKFNPACGRVMRGVGLLVANQKIKGVWRDE
jgi:hypothetical protein